MLDSAYNLNPAAGCAILVKSNAGRLKDYAPDDEVSVNVYESIAEFLLVFFLFEGSESPVSLADNFAVILVIAFIIRNDFLANDYRMAFFRFCSN